MSFRRMCSTPAECVLLQGPAGAVIKINLKKNGYHVLGQNVFYSQGEQGAMWQTVRRQPTRAICPP